MLILYEHERSISTCPYKLITTQTNPPPPPPSPTPAHCMWLQMSKCFWFQCKSFNQNWNSTETYYITDIVDIFSRFRCIEAITWTSVHWRLHGGSATMPAFFFFFIQTRQETFQPESRGFLECVWLKIRRCFENHRYINYFSTACLGWEHRKHPISALLTLCGGNQPVDSPHKWPETQTVYPYHDVIMQWPETLLFQHR